MALTTANGGAFSDSYATVRQANYYLRQLYGADGLGTWADLTEFQVEFRLRIATQMIGILPIRGRKSFWNQALAFPVYAPDIPQNNPRKVPGPIVEATILIAFGIVHRGLANESSPDEGVAAGRVNSVSLSGLLSVSFANGPVTGGTILGSIIRTTEFPIYMLLKPWLSQIRMFQVMTPVEEAFLEEASFTTTTTLIPELTTTTLPLLTTTTAVPQVTTTTSV